MSSLNDKKVSLRSLSGLSDDSLEGETNEELENYDERKWRLSHLKSQFESLELHKLFDVYTDKINHGYFSLFLILQGILSLTHFLVLVLSNYQDKEYLILVIPDLTLYLLIFILSIFGLYIVDKIAEHRKLQYLSLSVFMVLFFVNAFVPFYHSVHADDGLYRPAYSSYLILSCYVFFSIHDIIVCFAMGLFVSIFDIMTLILITFVGSDMLWQRIFSEVIYLMCINGLGIYFRYMNEIVIRRSFLDRRDCIMSTFQLRHEKEQGEQLMSSIIPNNIINKVKQNYVETTKYFLKNKKILQKNPFDNSLLDEHDDVTILFADIVHYTEMTIKLNISDLLETLNDLFGWFDEASEKLKVIRIKFLGDCYYCVAGLPPDPAPNHAEACVDLGLAMIAIIASVRKKRNLNINMRIGVHTGKIISGIIGAVKYQFDIWSRDVDIANKMESEGSPGKVHITNKTKDLLEKQYNIIPTDKGKTVPQFQQYNLQTFLVSPTEGSNEIRNQIIRESNGTIRNQPRSSIFKKQRGTTSNGGIILPQIQNTSLIEYDEEKPEVYTNYLTIMKDNNNLNMSNNEDGNGNDRIYRRRVSNSPYRGSKLMDERRSTADIKRRTAFMNNNIKRYAERATAVNLEMEKTIDDISYSKYEQYVKVKDINSIFLFFKKRNVELGYITIPDPLFKYYLLGAVILIFCVYLIQNLTLSHWAWTTWPFMATEFLLIVIFLPLSWTHFIWTRFVTNMIDSPPSNRIIRFLCRTSKCIKNNFIVRLTMYTLIYILFCVCVLMELIVCEEKIPEGGVYSQNNLLYLLFSRSTTPEESEYCIIPWHMTETCILTIIMTFLFLRIFIWFKLLYLIIIVSIYSYCILHFTKGFYVDSETFNYGLQPQSAHIISVVFTALTLHLIDRQTDYMNRLDYLLNEKLKNEQDEANELQIVNKNLLLNILPKHVAKIYLDVNREMRDLYYEEHNDVAVMFASIVVDDDVQDILGDTSFLVQMNEYITSFDTLINRREFRTIEKIKIAKWTYMAACGLFPGGKVNEIERHVTSATLETLLSFASNMFKKLKFNNLIGCRLRIGISHGPIIAGVVGSKKPLYDIWGDPVNMASRMDSTGIPNRIQVMEGTAQIIEKLGYICDYRGEILVKGRENLVKTYFVRLDDDYNLIKSSTEIIDGVNVGR